MSIKEQDRTKLARFLESPWARVALGAGVAGAVGLTVMVLLRIRKRHKEQSQQLKQIARDAPKVSDQTALLIEAAESMGNIVEPGVVKEVAEIISDQVQNPSQKDTFRAISSLAGPKPRV